MGQPASFLHREKENVFDRSGGGPQGSVGPMRPPPRRAVSQPRSPLGILWEPRRDPPGSGHSLHPFREVPLEALPPLDPDQLPPSSEGENSVRHLFLFPGRCSGNGPESLRGDPDPLTTPLSRAVALVPSPGGRVVEGCYPGQEASDSPRDGLGERLWEMSQSEPQRNSANSAISANFGFQEEIPQRNSANSANFPQGDLISPRQQALSGNFPCGNTGGISTEMVAYLSGEPRSRGLRRSFLPMVISEGFLSPPLGGVYQIPEAPSAALSFGSRTVLTHMVAEAVARTREIYWDTGGNAVRLATLVLKIFPQNSTPPGGSQKSHGLSNSMGPHPAN